MTQYLVAIHHPDDFDPSVEDEATQRDIVELNNEMKAAGAVIFVGGLQPVRSAKSVRMKRRPLQPAPWPTTDMNEALKWGRKAAIACRAPVEVRPFN